MFEHRPNNTIHFSNENLRLPLDFFLEQEPGYQLPEGATHRIYIPGQSHFLFSENNQWGGPMPWEEGDRYLSNVASYQAIWERRLVERSTTSEPTTVEAAREYVAQQINQLRVQKEVAGIIWEGHSVQTRPNDLNNINAEVVAVQVGARVDGEPWRMGDNQMVFLTNRELVEMAMAVRDHVKSCYQTAWGHRAVIEKLTVVKDIINYDYQQGWD